MVPNNKLIKMFRDSLKQLPSVSDDFLTQSENEKCLKNGDNQSMEIDKESKRKIALETGEIKAKMSPLMTKPTMWLCAQRRLSLIRVFAVRMKKAWALSYPLITQRRL